MNKHTDSLKEILSYLLFGVLTTIINIVTFSLLDIVNIHYAVSTFISWFVSVLFAFYTNRKYVFKSNTSKNKLLKELYAFFGARIVSLLIDLVLMFVLINILGISNIISKIIINIIIVIINYILSKLFIFKK